MANILRNIFTTGSDEIQTSFIVEAWHVSQSVDALTGTKAYDITISGSLTATGSTNLQDTTILGNTIISGSSNISGTTTISGSIMLSGSTFVSGLNNTSQTNVVTINPSTGQLFYITSSTFVTPPTTPAGSTTEIQFNNGGAFGASSNFKYITNRFQQGSSVTASGAHSHAQGIQTLASGDYSHAEGIQTTASADYSHAEGSLSVASGLYSHAEGNSTLANTIGTHAEGYYTTASGFFAHAEGEETTAFGYGSHAEGLSTLASGSYSHAEGYLTIASGAYSHAEGQSSVALGIASHAEGLGTRAVGDYTLAVGTFNNPASSSLFVVGNGVWPFPSPVTQSNAFRVSSSGECFAGGAFTNNLADYAEYFESYDGLAIPYGTVVELTGSYIKPCATASNAIGVISPRPGVLGNSDEGTGDEWVGKYEKDVWGNYSIVEYEYQLPTGKDEEGNLTSITAKGTYRKLSPEYDPSLTYIPRSQRPEWNVVGLLGQIKVLKNQPVPDRWVKMKDINDAISLYLVR
jgi:hypothetical protein